MRIIRRLSVAPILAVIVAGPAWLAAPSAAQAAPPVVVPQNCVIQYPAPQDPPVTPVSIWTGPGEIVWYRNHLRFHCDLELVGGTGVETTTIVRTEACVMVLRPNGTGNRTCNSPLP
jgi:hypothetical protein